MKKIYLLLGLLIILFSRVSAQTVTWADNIACLLYTHCTTCHHVDGIAPMALMDYNDALTNDSDIMLHVNDGSMPPWPPDQSYTNLAHPRILTQQEIDLINQWVAQGAPLGNAANAPTPPVYTGAAQITNPDLTVQIPNYTLPIPMTSDIYRCFVITPGLAQDEFATSLEVLPGNPGIVHHVLLYEDSSQTPVNLDNGDPSPGYTCFGGTGSQSSRLIGGWTPGAQMYTLPNGMGIKLKANSRLIAQVHYPQGSDGQTDSTRANFRLTTNSLREVFQQAILNEYNLTNGPLFMPANTVTSFKEQYQVATINYTLLSVFPHMHLLGKSIKSYFVNPQGDTTKMISIPDWNFHWQGTYFFRHPVKVAVNSNMFAEATYDNTTNNPNNPNSPPQNVSWGEQTTDEMMLVFFSYMPYFPGDENIIIDTTTSIATYNNCNEFANATGISNVNPFAYAVYPNPASGKLFIRNPGADEMELNLMNMTGASVLNRSIHSDDYLDVSGLASGVYTLRINKSGEFAFRKIVISTPQR